MADGAFTWSLRWREGTGSWPTSAPPTAVVQCWAGQQGSSWGVEAGPQGLPEAQQGCGDVGLWGQQLVLWRPSLL